MEMQRSEPDKGDQDVFQSLGIEIQTMQLGGNGMVDSGSNLLQGSSLLQLLQKRTNSQNDGLNGAVGGAVGPNNSGPPILRVRAALLPWVMRGRPATKGPSSPSESELVLSALPSSLSSPRPSFKMVAVILVPGAAPGTERRLEPDLPAPRPRAADLPLPARPARLPACPAPRA